MATLRVEFVKIQQSNSELFAGADNVISGRAAPSVEAATTTTALTGSSRIAVPDGTVAVRMTALGGPVYVEWGENPTASSANGIRLATDAAETFAVKRGQLISAMNAVA